MFQGDLETNACVGMNENLDEEFVKCNGWKLEWHVSDYCVWNEEVWKPMRACRKCREMKICWETNKVKWYLRSHWRYQLEYGSF